MLKPPDGKNRRAWEGLFRLAHAEEFQEVRAWLRQEYETRSEANDIEIDNVRCRQGQGCTMTLRELFHILNQAEGVIRAHRQS